MLDPRKIALIFFCFTAAFMLSSRAYGLLTMEIDPPGRNVVDFGEIAPGDYKELPESGYWHALVVKNDAASQWHVSISYDGVLRNGLFTIPREKFGWMATYAGSKNASCNNYSDGLIPIFYRFFSESGETFFRSENSSLLSAANHITTPNGAEIQLKYFLAIPDDQISGTYTTRITYTLTQ